MRAATIRHNDEKINKRIGLYVRRDRASGKNVYGIFTSRGEDAGGGRWPSRTAALAAIEYLWGASAWDLQFD